MKLDRNGNRKIWTSLRAGFVSLMMAWFNDLHFILCLTSTCGYEFVIVSLSKVSV